jgi:hypothetical protein
MSSRRPTFYNVHHTDRPALISTGITGTRRLMTLPHLTVKAIGVEEMMKYEYFIISYQSACSSCTTASDNCWIALVDPTDDDSPRNGT